MLLLQAISEDASMIPEDMNQKLELSLTDTKNSHDSEEDDKTWGIQMCVSDFLK